ncbi:recombinase family protein [Flagellimonas onchidii]|uniref:recombinase family protein n=1 Tax=Flagellimonas onchidii TaxID=2562684 RepID=UPI0010A5B264|nr:recombinase family protein [Allomuricauda onchidii]
MLAIYTRKSQENKDRNTSSLEEQQLFGIEMADKLGVPYEIYNEGIGSGALELKKRPEFVRMLQDINDKDSKIKAVYAYDSSRLYRNDDTKFQFLTVVKKKNIELYFKSGKFDWNNPQDKLLFNIISATDEFFVDLTSLKIQDKLRLKVSQGKVNGGVQPYGYTKDKEKNLVIHDEEAKIVRYIFKAINEGKTSVEIRNYLIDNEVPTRYNKMEGTKKYIHNGRDETRVSNKSDSTWTNGTILQILRNPIYKGERKWHDEIYPAPIIIPPVEWEKANKSFINRNKGSLRGKNTEHKYLLTPLLQCGCGKSLTGRSHKLENYYACASKRYKENTCEQKYIPIRVLDGFLTHLIYGKLYDTVKESFSGDYEEKRAELKKSLDTIEAEIGKVESNQDRIDDFLADGTYTKERHQRQFKRLNEQLTDLEIKKGNINESLNSLSGDKHIIENIQKNVVEPFYEHYIEPDELPYTVIDGKDPIKDKFQQIIRGEYAKKIPFEERQKNIRQYIKNIIVTINKEARVNEIEVHYRLPIEPELYLMDDKNIQIVNAKHRGTEYMNLKRVEKSRDVTLKAIEKRLQEYTL